MILKIEGKIDRNSRWLIKLAILNINCHKNGLSGTVLSIILVSQFYVSIIKQDGKAYQSGAIDLDT